MRIGHMIAGDRTASSRCCRLVLQAIARRADWKAWTWGERSYRSAEGIGLEIGYSERSVRYAYRLLEEDGWLRTEERAGRTNVFTVLRPVEPPPRPRFSPGGRGRPVEKSVDPVDIPVDNPPSDGPRTPASVADPPATLAADLSFLPTQPPPEGPPVARKSNEDGAGAPAESPSAALARGGAPPAESATSPPPAVEPGAEPHRRMRGAGSSSGSPDPAQEEPAVLRTSLVDASRRLGWGDPPSGWARGEMSGQPTRRDQLRRSTVCPTCQAQPGEACRGRGGSLRVANHKSRGAR